MKNKCLHPIKLCRLYCWCENCRDYYTNIDVMDIKNLKHEVQQDEMPLGNEQWKEGYNKAIEDIIKLIK